MSQALTRPPGDPEALYAAAARFGRLAADTSRAKDSLQGGVETALRTWRSPRATTFAQAAGDLSKRLDSTSRQFGIANQVLAQYANALAGAQAAIDRYAAQHASVGADLYRASGSATNDPGQEARLLRLSQQQGRIEEQAAAVQADLRTAATRATAALDAATELRVKGAATLSADEILRHVTGAWNAIHQAYRSFKEWADPNLAVLSLGQGVAQTGAALDAVHRWRSAIDAELLFTQTRNLEEAKATAVAMVHGTQDYRALKAWMQAQEVVSRYADDARRATEAARSARTAFVDSVRLTSKFAKACAVVGVVSGVYDMVNPQHDGWRGVGDRVMGGVAVAAGTAQLAVMAGLFAVTPVGAAVIAGALIATAAWTVGNLVWDHREQIGDALSTAGEWVGDQAGKAVEKVGEGVKKIGSKIASGIGGLFG